MTRNVIQSLWRELSVLLRRWCASAHERSREMQGTQGNKRRTVEPEWAREERAGTDKGKADHETAEKEISRAASLRAPASPAGLVQSCMP